MLAQLPGNESRHIEQQIAYTPRTGERKASWRIEAKHAADQNEGTLLHAKVAWHEKSDAADELY